MELTVDQINHLAAFVDRLNCASDENRVVLMSDGSIVMADGDAVGRLHPTWDEGVFMQYVVTP